jgi:hypothetical protein
MHTPGPWGNRLLFSPIIKDKQNKLSMNNRLSALVKRMAELREARLKVCHCIEEFHLRRIHPLGHWEKLAFKCPQLSDPNREPTEGKTCFLLHLSMISSF